MQRYKIIHRTYYNYSKAVVLGQHDLLLRPREDHELRIESFDLSITPSANILWHRDVEGNSVGIATFDTATRQLFVESKVIIQQFNESPLDFMVEGYAVNFPFSYHADDHLLLSAYLMLPEADVVKQLEAWIVGFWSRDEPIQTYTLLQRLARYIYQTQSYCVREAPGVQTSKLTLDMGTGSCRDFALLFMDAARCLGLASRFVSGYLHDPLMSSMAGATHAWAEVYLPGAGWKGFDPTTGCIVGSDHIPVAVSLNPEAVPPIKGLFSGEADSSLDVGVWVSLC